MNYFRDYKYGITQVTAIVVDTTNANYVWIAFSQNSNKLCLLKKVSAFDLSQVYYTVQVPVASINGMVIANNHIFLAVSPEPTSASPNAFCYMYSVTNPLTSFTFINRPVGVDENPVALSKGASNVYLLTPGIISATPAKVINVTQLNVFVETIVLQESALLVIEASTIVVDAIENLWVATNQAPSHLIRIFKTAESAPDWEFQETILT